MENACVRIFSSKKPELAGRKFYAVVVKYDGGQREKLFFDNRGTSNTMCALLNCSPLALYDLPCGDYPIV